MSDSPEKETQPKAKPSAGLSLGGVVLGLAFGLLLDNLALGILFALMFGSGAAETSRRINKKRISDSNRPTSEDADPATDVRDA
ncbi:hypothetical protein KQI52_11675 [bacterium]|nr:hypothetical protein [bacterium]